MLVLHYELYTQLQTHRRFEIIIDFQNSFQTYLNKYVDQTRIKRIIKIFKFFSIVNDTTNALIHLTINTIMVYIWSYKLPNVILKSRKPVFGWNGKYRRKGRKNNRISQSPVFFYSCVHTYFCFFTHFFVCGGFFVLSNEYWRILFPVFVISVAACLCTKTSQLFFKKSYRGIIQVF